MIEKRFKILLLIIGLQLNAGLLFASGSLETSSSNSDFFKSSDPVKRDTASLILQLMRADTFFTNYIDSVESFEIQIIYIQIDRDRKNRPSFRQFNYRLNDKVYFCPASTSKLPVTLLALEKVNKLSSKGIDIYTPMAFDSAYICQERAIKDTIAPDSVLCVANYIKKIMLVSDNDSYNRLFQFLGQQPLNERLWEMGYKKTSIIQQFNNCNADGNRFTNPMRFISNTGKTLYFQPLIENKEIYSNPLGTILKGKGYMGTDGKIVEQPRDFTFYNNLPLNDLSNMMLRLYFPNSFEKKKRFHLKEENYPFLYKYMSMLPRESEMPKYHNEKRYADNHKKYLMFGTDSFKTIKNSQIRSFNIVGQMGGYLTDCAYIVDFEHGVEFILAATIYNNQSGIFYVPNYRYATLGFPFLEKLGQTVYNYEVKRIKKYQPNLQYLQNCIK